MNKSQIARDFWRKIFDENIIDLRNADARNKAVREFLANPANKTWRQKDRRFFRLGFDAIARERNFDMHKIGVKPIPKTMQKQAGSMRMNIKTDEKKIPSGLSKPHEITAQELKQSGTEATQGAQQAAAYYSAENVAVIFDTMFSLLHARYPSCSKLTLQEKNNLGETWRPIFDKYLSDKGGIWVMPLLATIPILLIRVSEFSRAKKEAQLQKDYFPNDDDKKDDDGKKGSAWRDIGKP